MAILPQVNKLVATAAYYASVTIAWEAISSATYYQTQYQKDGATTWRNGPRVAAPAAYAKLTGLDAGVTYNFRVYAIGA